MSLQYSLELLDTFGSRCDSWNCTPTANEKHTAVFANCSLTSFDAAFRLAESGSPAGHLPLISVRKSSAQASKQRAIAFHSATQRRIGSTAVPAAGRGLLDCRKVLPLTLRCQDFPRHSAISF